MAKAELGGLSGVLPVDKPEGPTSHDAVAAVRRALRMRRVGHTGTLDPFATGLLLICLGPATRLAEYLTARPKTYRATMRLGEATNTDDLTGEVVRRSDDWRSLGEEEIREALRKQVGTIDQLPPLFSAKKVEGRRMYDAARRGEEIERRPSTVTIHRLDIHAVRLPEIEFEVDASAGTYIRAIARDVGETLGVGGHLRSLRRTRIGQHDVADTVPLHELDDTERVAASLLSPAEAVSHLSRVVVEGHDRDRVAQGGRVAAPVEARSGGPVAICSASGELLAIGEVEGESIQPRKVFA